MSDCAGGAAQAIGHGFDVFLEPAAQRINAARLAHLRDLGLPLAGRRVLEVGAGIGLLTGALEAAGCEVLSTDGAPANVADMLQRWPDRQIGLIDLDRPGSLEGIGRFDIVFCYGTLYHLRDPDGALARLAAVCTGLILVETIVARGAHAELHLVEEPPVANQALRGIGCRPTRAWVMAALRRHFGHAYATLDQPDHPDFVRDWSLVGHDGNLRAVFVGARQPLDLPGLTEVLPLRQGPPPPSPAPAPSPATGRRVWLDVGAHRGEHGLAAARRDPDLVVHAFEPQPALHAVLAEAPPNHHVHALAVAETDGLARFRLNRFAAASSLAALDPDAQAQWRDGELLAEERQIVVQTTRLDSFLDARRIDRVAVLKIDAQGGDFAVLRSAGARLADIDRITLEVAVTPRQLYVGAADKATILAWLAERGFRLTDTESQSHGQEENLTFVREGQAAVPPPGHHPGSPPGSPLGPPPGPVAGPTPFAFTAARLAHGAMTRVEEVLTIRTDPRRWAYAVLVPPGHAPAQAAQACRLTLALEVTAGAVQCGLLDPAHATFLQTVTVRAGAGWQQVTLTTPPLGACGALVIRNASEAGESEARCRLVAAELLPLPVPPALSAPEAAFHLAQLDAAAQALAAAAAAGEDGGASRALRRAMAPLNAAFAPAGLALVDTDPAPLVAAWAALPSAELVRLAQGLAQGTAQGSVQGAARPAPLQPQPGWSLDAFRRAGRPEPFVQHALWRALVDRADTASLDLPWHGGTTLTVAVGSDLGFAVFVGGCFEPNEFALLDQLLQPGMVAIDGGANDGAYALFMASRVGPAGRVLAVEPSPRELARLRANLAQNGLTTVEVVAAALAETAGEAGLLLAEDRHAGQNTLGALVYRDVQAVGRITVPLTTLDAVVAAAGVGTVDVVKLDLEGAELRALAGGADLLARHRPLLLLEAFDAALRTQGGSLRQLSDHLAAAGYRLFRFDDLTGQPVAAGPLDTLPPGNLVAVHHARRFGL